MEAVANRAGVGKPTLYKWWPTKAALVLAMFRERISCRLAAALSWDGGEAIRDAARALDRAVNGQLGKVLCELMPKAKASQRSSGAV